MNTAKVIWIPKWFKVSQFYKFLFPLLKSIIHSRAAQYYIGVFKIAVSLIILSSIRLNKCYWLIYQVHNELLGNWLKRIRICIRCEVVSTCLYFYMAHCYND